MNTARVTSGITYVSKQDAQHSNSHLILKGNHRAWRELNKSLLPTPTWKQDKCLICLVTFYHKGEYNIFIFAYFQNSPLYLIYVFRKERNLPSLRVTENALQERMMRDQIIKKRKSDCGMQCNFMYIL